jgi:hypothetical protein
MQDHTTLIFDSSNTIDSARTRRRRAGRRRHSPVLSQRELQRIVAAMLG